MSILDTLSANLTNAGRTVSQKVKNSSEAGTLTREMNTEKRNIQMQIEDIGRQYFEKHKHEIDPEFSSQIQSILASEQRIAELQEEIQAVRAREPELIPVPESTTPRTAGAQPSAMVCMQCGKTYAAGQTFCAACGSQLVPQYGGYSAPRPAPAPAPVDPVIIPIVNQPPTAPTSTPTVPTAPVTPAPEASAPEASAPEASAPEAPEKTAAGTPVPETPVTGRFCPFCGARADQEGQTFCTQCGKSLPV